MKSRPGPEYAIKALVNLHRLIAAGVLAEIADFFKRKRMGSDKILCLLLYGSSIARSFLSSIFCLPKKFPSDRRLCRRN